MYWVEANFMGPDSISRQVIESRISIPGFKRDPSILNKLFRRYIPPLVIMNSIFLGIISAMSGFINVIVNLASIFIVVTTLGELYREILMEKKYLKMNLSPFFNR